MGVFKDEHEVDLFLGEIFRRALVDEYVGPKMERAGIKLRVDYTDPEAVLWVDMGNKEVLTGSEAQDKPWDCALALSADDGHQFWLGRLNFTVAMTRGQIRTKGPVSELLKLLPLAKPLFATYEQILRDKGREDLIEVGQ